MQNAKEELSKLVREKVEENNKKNDINTSWRSPLTGAADAEDDLFPELKEAVSLDHMLPKDMLPEARSVFCYFLPFESFIPESNAGGDIASETWAKAYLETNNLIGRINNSLQYRIEEMGGRAEFASATHNFSREELISFWSHKHVAFIAGLGNFGVHKVFITEKGCAGRLGSIVTDLEMPASERPEQEFCLARADQECRKCIENCTFSALTDEGLDKERCYQICLRSSNYYESEDMDCCGKCTVDTPCTMENPVK